MSYFCSWLVYMWISNMGRQKFTHLILDEMCHLYRKFASHTRCILCKTRLILPCINGPIAIVFWVAYSSWPFKFYTSYSYVINFDYGKLLLFLKLTLECALSTDLITANELIWEGKPWHFSSFLQPENGSKGTREKDSFNSSKGNYSLTIRCLEKEKENN